MFVIYETEEKENLQDLHILSFKGLASPFYNFGALMQMLSSVPAMCSVSSKKIVVSRLGQKQKG